MRGPVLVLIWIVATMAATGLAWAGVRSVVAGVAAPLPAPTLATSAKQASTLPVRPPPEPATPDTPEPAQATTRAFQLVGGTATVRFTRESVTVLSAVPASGFRTDVEANDNRTRVEFESESHRSRLEVWWADQPRHQVEERAQGGGDNDHGGDGDRSGSDEGDD